MEVCTFPLHLHLHSLTHSHSKLPCADCMEKEQLSKAIKMEMYCKTSSGLILTHFTQTQDMSRQTLLEEHVHAHTCFDSKSTMNANTESNARYEITLHSYVQTNSSSRARSCAHMLPFKPMTNAYIESNARYARLLRVLLRLIENSNSPSTTISRLQFMLASSLVWTLQANSTTSAISDRMLSMILLIYVM